MQHKSIVIGDLHLRDKGNGYIEFQIKSIIDLINSDDYFAVIFLGDVFDKRRPSPTELLRLNDIINSINTKKTYIIRGNHESETKSDNGVTVLSLYHNPNKGVHVFEHTTRINHKHFPPTTFIPHYENPLSIIESLDRVPEGDMVFGHFGFKDDDDFKVDFDAIALKNFNNFTILGHIHRYKKEGQVHTLGTPYTVNYGEHNKECYYGIIRHTEDSYKFTKRKHKAGIKHIVSTYEDLDKYTKYFNSNKYYTLVKLLLKKLDEDTSFKFKNEILEKYNIDVLDMVYSPIISMKDDADELSTYVPNKELFKIDDTVIENYVTNQTTDLTKEDIMRGYDILSND